MADEQDSGKATDQERLIPDEERADDGQVYVNRDNIDFDPQQGLYSGTAVHGGTDIPGPHEQVDDVDAEPPDNSAAGDGPAERKG